MVNESSLALWVAVYDFLTRLGALHSPHCDHLGPFTKTNDNRRFVQKFCLSCSCADLATLLTPRNVVTIATIARPSFCQRHRPRDRSRGARYPLQSIIGSNEVVRQSPESKLKRVEPLLLTPRNTISLHSSSASSATCSTRIGKWLGYCFDQYCFHCDDHCLNYSEDPLVFHLLTSSRANRMRTKAQDQLLNLSSCRQNNLI